MTKSFIASLLFFLIIFSFMQNWVILFAASLVLFSVRYTTIGLIPVALLLDGYYGHFHTFPTLTLIALGWYLFVEYLRPKLVSVYADR